MKQHWHNFYDSKHCFQQGDLKKKFTWAGIDRQSSPLQTKFYANELLPPLVNVGVPTCLCSQRCKSSPQALGS
jgi:hypothetical protein